MAVNRNYSSVARATTITTTINGSVTTIPVTDTTGFPTVPFTLVIDPGRGVEEAVTVTNQVGLSLTVIRGVDGTGGQPHDAGASIRHMATARDYREPQEHIAATNGVHGVSSQLVGVTDGQVLDNKTFTAASTDHTAIVVKAGATQTAPLLVFQSAAGSTVASISTTGALTGAGLASTSANTFTAGTAATTPITVTGAASQSANLLNVKDSTATTLAFISPTGALSAAGLTSTAGVTATGRVATPGVDGSSTSTFSSSAVGITPLIAKGFSGQTADLFQAQSSSAVALAGVLAAGQLYHGGSNANVVPFKVHVGSIACNIASGNASAVVTENLTPYGFTQAPFIVCSLSTNETVADARRAAVIHEVPTTTAVNFRVVQTAGVNLAATGNYTVQYIAIQMTPGSSAG